jgi:hypothetical protein
LKLSMTLNAVFTAFGAVLSTLYLMIFQPPDIYS